jgi:hypothetical protein
MKKRVYIVSHSSIDLVSVLSLYERYSREWEVVILISDTEENLRFLQSVRVSESVLRLLNFESRNNKSKKQLVGYLYQLLAEKKALDRLIAEISASRDNEVFFHSYDNDPQVGYLVSQVSRSNRVTLIDVLGIRPKALQISDLLTKTGIKNIVYLAVVSAVFGRLFILSGTRSYPNLSLDLGRVTISLETASARGNAGGLAKYRCHVPGNGKNVVFLYSDSFGVPEEVHEAVNREIVECLARNGLAIYVKMHPQSRRPGFLDEYRVRYIPQYVPFELVDLANVSLVVGIAGASLIGTGEVPTVSIAKLVYQEDSDYYVSAMTQLRQNPAIVFVSSVDDLEKIVAELG